MQGELELFDTKVLTVGDTVEARLRIWPYTKDLNELYKIEGSELTDFFYIVSVDSIKVFEEESKATEIFLQLALRKEIEKKDVSTFKYKGLEIPISIPEIITIKKKLTAVDFKKWKQKDLKTSPFPPWPLLLILPLFFLIFFIFRKKSKRSGTDNSLKIVEQLLKVADSREALEKLYTHRKTLKKLSSQRALNDFLKAIDEHQYKKEWTKEELISIETPLKKLRRSL